MHESGATDVNGQIGLADDSVRAQCPSYMFDHDFALASSKKLLYTTLCVFFARLIVRSR